MKDSGDCIVEFFFLIPLRLNNNRKVPNSYFNKLEDELFRLCGGHRVEGRVKGAYKMADGSRQLDELLKYVVALPASKENVLREILQRCAVELDQESIYFGKTGAQIEFLQNPKLNP